MFVLFNHLNKSVFNFENVTFARCLIKIVVFVNKNRLGSLKNKIEDAKIRTEQNLRDQVLKQFILDIINSIIIPKIKTQFFSPKIKIKTDPP